MSNSSRFALTTAQPDRFYSPPALRRNQQQQRVLSEPNGRVDSEDSTLSRPNSVGSSSSTGDFANLTNLDRLLASLKPLAPAQLLSEARTKGRGTHESNGAPYFFLEDLWESFRQWSAYGVEVPLSVNGSDSIKQYYVPYLSAIQLYVDSQSLRRFSEDSGAESSKPSSSSGSSDINASSQRLSRLLRERTTFNSSSDATEGCNTPGQLVYEYFEVALPHMRHPFHDKVSALASEFPILKMYRSCDLSPSSWFSVAWYPIYRIPVGSTLKSLDAAFLTFHLLSTHPQRRNQLQFHASNGKKVHAVNRSPNIPLPAFALASYKLRGSILSASGDSEWHQANSLMQAAADWLQKLQVNHPDYQYFVTRRSQWR